MNVQDVLKSLDRGEIINEYLYEPCYTPRLLDDKYKYELVGQMKRQMKEDLEDLLDRLLRITPEENTEGKIFIAAHTPAADFAISDIEYYLFSKDDIKEKKETYMECDFFFAPYEVSLGYEVADTYLSGYALNRFAVDYLYKIAWSDEEREAVERDLEKADKEVKEGSTVITGSIKDLFGDDIEFEEEDPDQIAAYSEFAEEESEYKRRCIEIEVEKWRKSQRPKGD